MKTTTHKRIKKWPIVILVVVVCIFVISTLYIFVYRGTIIGWSPYMMDSDSLINEQNTNGSQIKQQSLQNTEKGTGQSGSDQPPSPKPQPNAKSIVDVIFTAANQSDSTVQIRVLISTVDSGGSCVLTLTSRSSGSVVTKQSSVQALSTTSTCQGFNIPLSELAPGIWLASILYENPNLTGSASTTIEVK